MDHFCTTLILCPNFLGTFAAVAIYPQTKPAITIFCGDSFLVQQPDGQWWDTSTPFHPKIVTSAGVLNAFAVFNCASSGNLAYAILPNMIVLCDKAFGRLGGGDTIGSLRQTTLLNQFLDGYNVLSGTLLHELLHIEGNGRSKSSNSCLFRKRWSIDVPMQSSMSRLPCPQVAPLPQPTATDIAPGSLFKGLMVWLLLTPTR